MQKMTSSLVSPTQVRPGLGETGGAMATAGPPQTATMPSCWRMCLVLFAIGALPLAARPATAGSSASEPDLALQEIVVTAEKRSEAALRTPVALSTYTGDDLQEQQITSITSLQNLDPSLNFSKSAFGGWPFLVIRGVSTTDATSGSTPGISFNVDGVPLNRGFEQTTAFLDIDRIEVLKGPQGTLYGQSSTGGTLNVITNKPSNELEARADVTVGNFNTRRATAVINLPISSWISLRAAVNSSKHDGYITPNDGSTPVDDQDDWTSRVSLLANFTDDMSLLLTETNGFLGGAGPGAGVNWDTLQSAARGAQQRVVFGGNPFRNFYDDTLSNFAGQFNWTLGPVYLTYIGALLNYTADEQQASTNNPEGNSIFIPDFLSPDPAAPPLVAAGPPAYVWLHLQSHTRTDSHELRVSNQKSGFADWVAGVNWYREDISNDDTHQWLAPYDPTNLAVQPTMAAAVNNFDFWRIRSVSPRVPSAKPHCTSTRNGTSHSACATRAIPWRVRARRASRPSSWGSQIQTHPSVHPGPVPTALPAQRPRPVLATRAAARRQTTRSRTGLAWPITSLTPRWYSPMWRRASSPAATPTWIRPRDSPGLTSPSS